jgi:16S rRNA U516 pseudouridylate synthase RsuA-like enzyme
LVAERPPVSALDQLRNGVELADGKTAPAEVRVASSLPQGIRLAPGPTSGVWLEIVLREGKKRQIRHMTAAVGFPTLRLVRWAIGPLLLGDLKAGESVPLIRREVAALRNALRAGVRPAVEPDVAPARRRTAGAGKPPARPARNQGNRSRPR